MSEYPTRRGELLGASDAGGWNIYDSQTDSLHSLNDSARAIWELCDGETSPDEMAKAISELTEISYEDARRDVLTTLKRLASSGLVYRD